MQSFVPLCAVTLLGLTIISLDAGTVPHTEIVMDEASASGINGTNVSEDYADAPIARQEEEERPYEYVPRVFHSLRKIIRGLLTGSVHDLFQGSFSFAPREVSNEIIGIYNQVVGLPDPTTPGYNATLEQLFGEDFDEDVEEAKA